MDDTEEELLTVSIRFESAPMLEEVHIGIAGKLLG